MPRPLLTVLLLTVHGVLSVGAVFGYIMWAYATSLTWSDYNDRLYSAGQVALAAPASLWVFYGLPVVGLLSLVGSVFVAAYPPARRNGWIVPVTGIAVSAAVVVFAMASFPKDGW